MKKIKIGFGFLSLFVLISSFQLLAQNTKSICEINGNLQNGEHVATYGNVVSVLSGDFWISDGGCSIKCDLQTGLPAPAIGMTVVVVGYVEVDDKKDDETEIDVYSWNEYGSNPPPLPDPTVFTTTSANGATPGTIAFLTGTVTSWTDEDDGEGIFTDNAGTIAIDFQSGNKPGLNTNILVYGTVDEEDNGKEIDVIYWYPEGGSPPPLYDIIYSAADVNAATDGTLALLSGDVTVWTNQNDGEGTFADNSGSTNVDFEDGLSLPGLNTDISIFGVVDTENMVKEIEVHYWTEDIAGIEELNAMNIAIYPNPAVDHITIEFDNNVDRLLILDMTGRIVIEKPLSGNSKIDVSTLSEGVYFVALFNRHQQIGNSKLIKR